jgi:hypothetical protein
MHEILNVKKVNGCQQKQFLQNIHGWSPQFYMCPIQILVASIRQKWANSEQIYQCLWI